MPSGDPTYQIANTGTSGAPLDYRVPGSQLIQLLAISATFDGTSAGQAWQPCVTIISDSSHLVARCPAAAAADGDVVEVTFAPFLRNDDQTGYIHFYTYAGGTGENFGDSLTVEGHGGPDGGIYFLTTGVQASDGFTDGSIQLIVDADRNDSPIFLQNNSGGQGGISLENNGNLIGAHRDGIAIVNNKTADAGKYGIRIENNGSSDFELDCNGGSMTSFVHGDRTVQATNIVLTLDSGNLVVANLPTSDPGVPGALWNSGGTIMQSP